MFDPVQLYTAVFWVAFVKIVWIDVLLSGDNALVIAMACRTLPVRQRLWGMILGAGTAVVMRIALTGIVANLMELPYLKVVGGVLLFYVAVKLLVPDDGGDDGITGADRLLSAIKTIVLADMVMSLDNVIAVAAASNGNMLLMALGLMLSIPLVVTGAAVIMSILERFPILVWAGSGVLGWIAGGVIVSDPVVQPYLSPPFESHYFYSAIGALLVLAAGATWRASKQEKVHV